MPENKPPFRIPLMAEIAALPLTGLTALSLFAGCGGSCLGLRMAGFRVLWANEFVPAARASYTPNHPETILDGRDIREIKAAEILEKCGLEVGQLDLLNGSPPCQSFSIAGKREKGWGKIKAHGDGSKQVSDDLFFEFARLLHGLQPRAFVAENVSGLVKGIAKGYFKLILARLKECGYQVEARVLDAQWLGVPQMRQRLIFIGMRVDLGLAPAFPKPLPYHYSVRDALPWIGRVVHDTEGGRPNDCLPANPADANHFKVEDSPPLSPSVLKGNRRQQRIIDPTKPSPTITISSDDQILPAEIHWPNNDFRKGARQSLDKPCPTVGAGQGTIGGNDSVVVDRRKFTIAELKRICAFPDDFQLVGSYSGQWARLGNAVPPMMMAAIGREISRVLLAGKLAVPEGAA